MTSSKKRTVNPLDGHLGYQLRRASNAMMTELSAALAAIGLKAVEASILVLIEANPGIAQGKIGQMLGIQRANMAPLAAGLLARGLVCRSPVDGRSYGFSLSPAGADITREALAVMRRHEARLAKGLSEIEKASFTATLAALRRNADAD
jgi:DNA-binding MarR family transcriptional regulator